jgi:hypothetical protein
MSTVLLPCGCSLEVPDGQTLSAQALDDLILNHLAKPTEDLVQKIGMTRAYNREHAEAYEEEANRSI